jgi:hypothetical protein
MKTTKIQVKTIKKRKIIKKYLNGHKNKIGYSFSLLNSILTY